MPDTQGGSGFSGSWERLDNTAGKVGEDNTKKADVNNERQETDGSQQVFVRHSLP